MGRALPGTSLASPLTVFIPLLYSGLVLASLTLEIGPSVVFSTKPCPPAPHDPTPGSVFICAPQTLGLVLPETERF